MRNRAHDRKHGWRRVGRTSAWIVLLLGLPGLASALPARFALTSGSVVLRTAFEGATASLFAGAATRSIDLDFGGVTWDADSGEVRDLSFGASGPFSIDLDERLVPIDSITLDALSWTTPAGHSTTANLFGQFNLPTILSSQVSGMLPSLDSFGPLPFVTGTAQTTGRLVSNGDRTLVRLTGINLALFELSEWGQPDPNAPRVLVKADFTFVAEAVSAPIPEPSAALLFGLGTIVVAAVQRQALGPKRFSR